VAVIKLPSGLEVTTFEPPRDFDPRTASADELERFGFPPPPEDPQHLDRYKDMLSQLAGRLDHIQPTFQPNNVLSYGPRLGNNTPAGTSTNWSGGVVDASIESIYGQWKIPHVSAPTQGQQYYAASWIGIGGDDGSGNVFQAGVECLVQESGGTIATSIFPWYQWSPGLMVQVQNFPVKAGDEVSVALFVKPGTPDDEGRIFFTNRTTGLALPPISVTGPSPGNSAEWIVGVPTDAGQPCPLANYGEVTFTECTANILNDPKVRPVTGIDMIAGGSVVSRGTVIPPSTVKCVYV
jgi:hypothetical protein